MSRMKIVSPATGAYIEKRIPLQLTHRHKMLMGLMGVGLVLSAYLAITNYLDGEWPSTVLFTFYVVFLACAMCKLYRVVRLYSHMRAQYRAMMEAQDE